MSMTATDLPSEITFIDRITTASGSVYEFLWLDPTWPANGHRDGYVRKPDEPWTRIGMVTRGFTIDGQMFWLREDGHTVYTSPIVRAEVVPS